MSGRTQRARIPSVVWIGAGAGGLGALAIIASGGGPSIPAVFMALALGMLLLALAALFQSLRAMFGDAAVTSSGLRATLPERAALLEEKNALLRAIKDITFEHEVGKLSDEDFERLDRGYRTRAKEVLRKLDEGLAPFLERAERLLEDAMARPAEEPRRAKKLKEKDRAPRRDCAKCGTSNALDAAWCKECGASMASRTCRECGTVNEPDAKFCIKCAVALTDEERSNEDRSSAPAEEAVSADRSDGEPNEPGGES